MPVKRMVFPVFARGKAPTGKSSKAEPVCVPPPSQRAATISPSATISPTPPEIEVWKGLPELGHKLLHFRFALARTVHRVEDSQIVGAQFVDNGLIVRIAPEPFEPFCDNRFVFVFLSTCVTPVVQRDARLHQHPTLAENASQKRSGS
nr:hypothetical protein [Acetobacter sacchari]